MSIYLRCRSHDLSQYLLRHTPDTIAIVTGEYGYDHVFFGNDKQALATITNPGQRTELSILSAKISGPPLISIAIYTVQAPVWKALLGVSL